MSSQNKGDFPPLFKEPLHAEQPQVEEPQKPLDTITQLGQMPMPPQEPDLNFHCMTIVGQIEGHIILPPKNKTTKYEHLIPQLVAIAQSKTIKGLLVVLNTVGGDIEAGLAIAEMIKSLPKPSVSLVLGGGHSIGVPIACSTNYSYIAETATMTIHPIRLTGMVISVPQTYEYLEKMQERVTKFVVGNSGIAEERFRELMFRTGELVRDVGTVLIGKEAVAEGIIDQVGGVGQALNKLQELIQQQEAETSEVLQ